MNETRSEVCVFQCGNGLMLFSEEAVIDESFVTLDAKKTCVIELEKGGTPSELKLSSTRADTRMLFLPGDIVIPWAAIRFAQTVEDEGALAAMRKGLVDEKAKEN